MAENGTGTLEAIGMEIAKVFQPFKERVDAGEIMLLLAELGIEFPESLANDAAFQTAVKDVADKVDDMATLVKELVDAIKAEDYSTASQKSIALVDAIAGVANDIKTIANEIKNKGPYPGISDTDLTTFVEGLAKNLIDYLVVNYLESAIPLFAIFLEFFGIIEETQENAGSTNPLLPPYTKKNLRLDRIPTFLQSPGKLAKELYDWGDDAFTGEKLFKILERLFNAMGLPAVYDASGGEPELDILMATMEPRTNLSPKGIALTIHETLGTSLSQTIKQDQWTLEFGMEAALNAGAGVSIQPDGNIEIEPPSGSNTNIQGKVFVQWTAKDSVTNLPLLLIGDRDESRLEAKELSAKLEMDFVWNGSKATGTFLTEAAITDGKLIIKPGNPDGFLAKVLPPEGFTVDFSILIGLSNEKGFYFNGSGTLELNIPTSISLGPIEIQNLKVSLTPGSEFKVGLGADIKAVLGPFTAVVQGIGMNTTLTFPEDRNGNLGPVNLALGFKPPTGVGLSLDAGVIKGGGFLLLDFDKGEYAGAIELYFEGLFGFSAIGIINTKFPDGSKGFSLLLLINVTFDTPITLGFNFYLTGIGGLIGLHRTVNTTALQNGVKDGSVENIMFPENVIANITKIISDLQSIFPIRQDQFVLGVMARITWNTPAILTIEAGLIIEFPNPVTIAILGVIKCALPTPDDAIIELNVAFVGIIDFENEMLSFDAAIFNSRILTITLEGNMALRIKWGKQPDFLVTVGGFHPTYTPPANLNLPVMKRITVNVLSGNPNLVLTAYFAVTTNTIQFGAAVDFAYKFSEFKATAHLGFDVLIQFSPFHFIAAISARAAITAGSTDICSIDLEFTLEGPTPWHAYGYGSFKIWFVKIKVSFDKTWGENRTNSLPSTEVLPLLLNELQKSTNWKTSAISGLPELVTMAGYAVPDGEVFVKPDGSLEIDQMVVPLDLTMGKFGNFIPADISKVIIKRITAGTESFSAGDLTALLNPFAPTAYKQMEDDDKLTAPSYEDEQSGSRLNITDDITFDYSINRIVQYETILSDFEETSLGLISETPGFFKPFISGGDVGRCALSATVKNNVVKASTTAAVAQEPYVVVSKNNLTNVHSEGKVFGSKSEADEYMKSVIKTNPSQKGKIQLSPTFQMA
jgi:hypothetical protein